MYGSLPNLKMEFDRQQSATSPMAGGTAGMMLGRPFTPPGETGNSQLSVSVLVNADMQSEGPPEEILMSNTTLKLEDLFEGFRSSLLKVIEWAKRIPAFVNLSLDDQVKLLKASWCEHCTLKLASRNGPKSDTILLSHGLSVKRESVEDPEVRRVLHRVFNEVAYWLDYLNVDRVEMACLRGIMLFNPGESTAHTLLLSHTHTQNNQNIRLYTGLHYLSPCFLRCQGPQSSLSKEGGDIPRADPAVTGDQNKEYLPSVSSEVLKAAPAASTSQGHCSGSDAAHGGPESPRQHKDGQFVWGVARLRVRERETVPLIHHPHMHTCTHSHTLHMF